MCDEPAVARDIATSVSVDYSGTDCITVFDVVSVILSNRIACSQYSGTSIIRIAPVTENV